MSNDATLAPEQVSSPQGEKITGEITGKHVLFITVSAFAVIISVNIFMAYQAVRSFPGLEVKNSYVASQYFDVQKKAQLALDWHVSAQFLDGTFTVDIRDGAGLPVRVSQLEGTIGRPTSVKEDQQPSFQFDGQNYVAAIRDLAPGNWNFRMKARAEDGTLFQQRVVFYVREQ